MQLNDMEGFGRKGDDSFLRAPLAATLYNTCLITEHSYGGRVSYELNPNPPCQHSLWDEIGLPRQITSSKVGSIATGGNMLVKN